MNEQVIKSFLRTFITLSGYAVALVLLVIYMVFIKDKVSSEWGFYLGIFWAFFVYQSTVFENYIKNKYLK